VINAHTMATVTPGYATAMTKYPVDMLRRWVPGRLGYNTTARTSRTLPAKDLQSGLIAGAML